MTYSRDAIIQVIDALNDTGAPYIVTGSLARNIYATPRSTLDGDFVVDMSPMVLDQFFKKLDVDFEREPQLAFETVTGKIQHKFRYRKTAFLIEIFEANFDDPHERARFERRKPAEVEGHIALVSTVEDLIVQKLRWFMRIRRGKDREDIRMLLTEQWRVLDWPYIERWCREHGSHDLLEEFKSEVKPLLA